MAGERPKRPLSAYMLWLNENREQIKKDNPGSKVTDIAKRGGELWRAIKDKTVSFMIYLCIIFMCIISSFLLSNERLIERMNVLIIMKIS